jgi:hypothetical protein
MNPLESKPKNKVRIRRCSKLLYEDPSCSNSLGPWYNTQDHLKYWDVVISACTERNPLPIMKQFVFPYGVIFTPCFL